MLLLILLIVIGIEAKRTGAKYVPWGLLAGAVTLDTLICGWLALALVPTP